MTVKSFQSKVPQIGEQVWIDDSAVIIGDVTIGKDSSVWPLVSIRGDMHRIRIGERCSIQDNSCLHITHDSQHNPGGFPVEIGNDVTVGHQVMLHGCTIGSRVLIGMSSTLLDGVVVEDDVMIGAGSLVPQGKCLASGYLYFGTPVKQIRPLSEQEIAYLKYGAANYVKLKDAYLAESSPSN
jgi:carbonic anhydrase/acetyltransferase-like protein (isoleucine patch superfamily)